MEITTKDALRRIKDLQRELEYLKRDLLQVKTKPRETLHSLVVFVVVILQTR